MAAYRFRIMLLSERTPNLRNFGRILSHIYKTKDYLVAASLCREMDALSIRFDVYIANIWISSYVNLGCVSFAFSVFGKMLKKECLADVYTYTTLLRGLCVERDGIDEAARFFRRLVLSDCPVNVVTFNTLVKGLTRMGRVRSAVSLLHEMDKCGVKGCQPDLFTYNTIFHGLCGEGFRKEALKLFHVMKAKKIIPNFITYNTLIWGLLFRRNTKMRARRLFNEMKCNDVEPTLITYTTLVSTLCKEGNLAGADAQLRTMMKSGLGPDIVSYNVLLKGLCMVRKSDKALQLLQKMSGFSDDCKPNIRSYNTVIHGLCRGGLVDRALWLFIDMTKQNIQPNIYTYKSLIRCLFYANRWEEGINLISEMKESGIVSKCVTNTTIINAFCKEKRIAFFYR